MFSLKNKVTGDILNVAVTTDGEVVFAKSAEDFMVWTTASKDDAVNVAERIRENEDTGNGSFKRPYLNGLPSEEYIVVPVSKI